MDRPQGWAPTGQRFAAHLQGFGSGIVRFLRGVFTVGNFNLAVKAAMVTNILSHLDRLVFIALRT
jgi:hypothetical protein